MVETIIGIVFLSICAFFSGFMVGHTIGCEHRRNINGR